MRGGLRAGRSPLLAAPRYEVLPAGGIEEAVAELGAA